ncbi:uncharacterized protein LOC132556659 [Ylistrum balloti]|uniref:uncharacterized protein LOC132556659 n=1 Tax=Ylistrum balloti TaxID=509963 RepID=UPI002905C57D|nr:uncharacterized protein LOC132556659 [Ylistrum balloti]
MPQLVQQILDSQDKKVILKHVKPCGLEAMCINHGIEFDSDLKQSTKDKMKENEAYFLQRKPDGSIPQEIKEYAVQDVTVLVDLYNKMKRYPGETMEPLYKRLIKVSLYAHLRGVDCRSMYERDKALMNHIATPDLAEHDVSPNSRRRLNGRGNKRKPRKR